METIVMSLGGSVIAPGQIDTAFLKEFRKLILANVNDGKRFIIICGGGKTARNYMSAAADVVKLADEDLDWIGIHATRLNGHLLRTIFRDVAYKRVVRDPREKKRFAEPVLIAAGWKPGWSTDHVAVLLAKNYGAKTIINVSSIDYVYDSDPRTNGHAKKIEKIAWKDFRKLVGSKWSPGLNAPFDPVASRKAAAASLRVIMTGKDIHNIKSIIENKAFKGTIIE